MMKVTVTRFDCPLWPNCNCPVGTMHPACPALKKRSSQNLSAGWWILPCVFLGVLFWLGLALLVL